MLFLLFQEKEMPNNFFGELVPFSHLGDTHLSCRDGECQLCLYTQEYPITNVETPKGMRVPVLPSKSATGMRNNGSFITVITTTPQLISTNYLFFSYAACFMPYQQIYQAGQSEPKIIV